VPVKLLIIRIFFGIPRLGPEPGSWFFRLMYRSACYLQYHYLAHDEFLRLSWSCREVSKTIPRRFVPDIDPTITGARAQQWDEARQMAARQLLLGSSASEAIVTAHAERITLITALLKQIAVSQERQSCAK
jgi:hypothetical protein